MDAPARTTPGVLGAAAPAAEAAYDVLQAPTAIFAATLERATEDRAYAERELAGIEHRLTEQKALVSRLRQHMTVALEQQTRLEALAKAMRTLALGTAPDDEGLRGHAIANAAVDVARRLGREREDFHYRDWFDLVVEAGYVIGGKDPEASFLTALTRHPGIDRVGARTGRYRLADPEPEVDP